MKKVFISYSHKDARWLDRLLVHLRPLQRTGEIELWAEPACGDITIQPLVTRNAFSKSGFRNNEDEISFLNCVSYGLIKTRSHPRAGIIVRAMNIRL